MSELHDLRDRIARNEVRGGSAFGRAVARVIALTAEANRDATPEALAAAVTEAAEWGVATKPSMTSVRVVADLATAQLAAMSGSPSAAIADAVAGEMRAFIAASEKAIASLADSGEPVFRDGARVLIHSFSESLLNVLGRAASRYSDMTFLFTESRPLKESRHLIRALADKPVKMKLFSDAAMAIAAAEADLAIVGADAILADGSFANKTGSLPLALICREAGIPYYVASEISKVHLGPAAEVSMEVRPAEELAGDFELVGTGRIEVWNQFFEVVPATLVTAYVTDHGVLDPAQIVSTAASLAAKAA